MMKQQQQELIALLSENVLRNCMVNHWCINFWCMYADSIPAKQTINETTTTYYATM
jgi:hypothetical protein